MTTRRAQVSACYSTAGGYASGSRRDLDEASAIAELHAVTTDPDVLAEAAAAYQAPGGGWSQHPHADAAIALLVAAGADPDAIERHAAARRARRGGGFVVGGGH